MNDPLIHDKINKKKRNETLELKIDLSKIVAEVDPRFLSVALDSHIGE